jgi:hypothetical protein
MRLRLGVRGKIADAVATVLALSDLTYLGFLVYESHQSLERSLQL